MEKVWQGTLRKMKVSADDPVSYYLADGRHDAENRAADHPLNGYLGRPLEIRFTGRINCVACGRPMKKSFGQGFCFPCSRTLAEADICIVRPELCHHGDPDNPCRDENFARTQCFRPHILYCSLTSGVKVGITRKPNIPSRWIDQGAVAAVPVAEFPDRRAVGLVEKRLSDEGFADKTHWSRMLKGDPPEAEGKDATLTAVAEKVVARLEAWGVTGILPAAERQVRRIRYPVLVWPDRVKSLNLDKTPTVGGVLQGIKGQYLIFDTGVINLRKYAGYAVEVAAAP